MDGDDRDDGSFDSRRIALQEATRTAAKALLKLSPDGFALSFGVQDAVIAATPERLRDRIVGTGFPSDPQEQALASAVRTLLDFMHTSAGRLHLTDRVNLYFGERKAMLRFARLTHGAPDEVPSSLRL